MESYRLSISDIAKVYQGRHPELIFVKDKKISSKTDKDGSEYVISKLYAKDKKDNLYSGDIESWDDDQVAAPTMLYLIKK